VSQAAWRLEQAGRERAWTLASARAEGISIRTLAAAAGLSPARVRQITAASDPDELDAVLGELRAAAWAAPEDPGRDDDAGLDGRDLVCDRLLDEVSWLGQCAGWLTRLHISEYPQAVNLRPDGDHPGRALVMAGLPRVAAILQRIAADVGELARARRVAGLGAAAALPDRRAGRRRRSPSRTWTSGSSAAAASCPGPSAPGICSPLNATGAAKPASRPIGRMTRSGTASRDCAHDPCPHRGVRQTGRPDVLPGTVVAGTLHLPDTKLTRSTLCLASQAGSHPRRCRGNRMTSRNLNSPRTDGGYWSHLGCTLPREGELGICSRA
jgi:hypothetical protein